MAAHSLKGEAGGTAQDPRPVPQPHKPSACGSPPAQTWEARQGQDHGERGRRSPWAQNSIVLNQNECKKSTIDKISKLSNKDRKPTGRLSREGMSSLHAEEIQTGQEKHGEREQWEEPGAGHPHPTLA